MDTLLQKQIGRVSLRVELEPDVNPDTSWIGTFSNEPDEYAIDHHERSGITRNTYQYFNPCNIDPDEPEKWAEKDYDHMMRLENGHSAFYGVVAGVRIDGKEIGFDSVWGFELDGSDSDGYIDSEVRGIAREALADARRFVASISTQPREE